MTTHNNIIDNFFYVYQQEEKAPDWINQIAKLVGIQKAEFAREIDIYDYVKNGIDADIVYSFNVNVFNKISINCFPPASLKRLKQKVEIHEPSTEEAASKFLYLFRVTDKLAQIYHGDHEKIKRFIERPHPLLDGKKPNQVLCDYGQNGAELIIDILERSQAGVAV